MSKHIKEFYVKPCTILTTGDDGELISETGWEFRSPMLSETLIVKNPDEPVAMELVYRWLEIKGLASPTWDRDDIVSFIDEAKKRLLHS